MTSVTLPTTLKLKRLYEGPEECWVVLRSTCMSMAHGWCQWPRPTARELTIALEDSTIQCCQQTCPTFFTAIHTAILGPTQLPKKSGPFLRLCCLNKQIRAERKQRHTCCRSEVFFSHDQATFCRIVRPLPRPRALAVNHPCEVERNKNSSHSSRLTAETPGLCNPSHALQHVG
ncbi:hypothetical protein BDU57DRAFT_21909 [Ampelomyces quisqualis]|uniref:Uncharacterized protein n=1 Tax=Ampelomyces quisqualis TaxID=50730 RepID=A0A6A5R3Y7_AMPQU|nr:hypothetical protein BDU57DRAFT_21909 [Ampelomyces quisqualis]